MDNQPLGEAGVAGTVLSQRTSTVMHMTAASWSRISRLEGKPMMDNLSAAMVRGLAGGWITNCTDISGDLMDIALVYTTLGN